MLSWKIHEKRRVYIYFFNSRLFICLRMKHLVLLVLFDLSKKLKTTSNEEIQTQNIYLKTTKKTF